MKTPKLLAGCLACLLLAATAASCSSTDISGTKTSDNPVADNEESPDWTTKTFGGEEFGILYRDEYAKEFIADSTTGEVVNDAVYKRNEKTAEKCDVKFKFIECVGAWAEQTLVQDTIREAVMSDDHTIDMVAGYSAYMPTLALEGDLLNILDMPEIHTDASWWSDKTNQALTVNDQLYMICGDISLSFWENMFVIFCNRNMAESYHIPDLYQMVENGAWTLDRLIEYAELCTGDVDGNGTFDDADMYGFVTGTNTHMRAWTISLDTTVVEMDEAGYPRMCFDTERTVDVVTKLVNFCNDRSCFRKNAVLKQPGTQSTPLIFTEGRGLFMTGFLSTAGFLRDSNIDYSILPYPKYDENQTAYQTAVHDSMTSICFPLSVSDPEMSAAVAETMCRYSQEFVIPAFYEKYIQTKLARDEENAKMVDLIRNSVYCDFGWSYAVQINSPNLMIQELVGENSTDFTSKYAANKDGYEAALKSITDFFKANGEG